MFSIKKRFTVSKIKFSWKWPKAKEVLTYSAIVISVCALFTTGYQTFILEQQKHAAVWPRLQILHGWNLDRGNRYYRLSLQNNGIGPALIDKVEIHYNGKSYSNLAEMAAAMSIAGSLPDSMAYDNYADLIPQMVVPQQEEMELLLLLNEKYVRNFVDRLDKVEVSVRYTSLYDRRYEVTYPELTHKEID